MQARGLGAVLVTHLPDVRYLCGFTGSNAALAVAPRRTALFTDGRYTGQAREETVGARVVIAKKSALGEACAWLSEAGVERVFFEGEHTTVAQLEAMRKAIPASRRRGFFQAAGDPLVSALRQVKDEDEIAHMRAAAALGVRLFEDVLEKIAPGVTEAAIAAELEYAARLAGAEGMSFETIVAAGRRSALPHGRATAARLPRRGFVTLDFGVILNGYCSDMTRTVHLGRATPQEREAYDAVLEAEQTAVNAARAGASCGDVDEAARGVLRDAGLAKHFTHSTGHGVGLEIHEAPRVGAGQKTRLEPGMVVTIEPGVYLPDAFGVRIEDTIVVRRGEAEILTPAPRGWIEL
jgi:Xaa-Pro aminopeptidase